MRKIHPEDPRVTAHALGELPKHEAAAVERAAMSNPEVQRAFEETKELVGMLRQGFEAEQLELGEERREAIRRAGRRPVPENLVSMRASRRWMRPVAVSAAAAAMVAGVVWIMTRIPAEDDDLIVRAERESPSVEARGRHLLGIAPRPAPAGRQAERNGTLPAVGGAGDGSATPVSKAVAELRALRRESPASYAEAVEAAAVNARREMLERLPELDDNEFVSCRDRPRSTVPVVSGRASFPLVKRFLLAHRELPPRRVVRVEELINCVGYRAEGDADLEGVRLGVELGRCPWDEKAVLMGILLRNESERAIGARTQLEVEMKPEHVRSYRLLGYANPRGATGQPSVTEGLMPGDSNYVLYQLLPAHWEVLTRHHVVARVALRLEAGGEKGLLAPATGPPSDWGNTSNNFRTAVALGAFGMLLRDSPYRGALDTARLDQLARDAMAGAPDDDLARREALHLIIEALPML